MICGLLAGLLLAPAVPAQAAGPTYPTHEVVEPVPWRFWDEGPIAGTSSVFLEVESGTCNGPTIDHVEVRPGPRQRDRFTDTIVVYGRHVVGVWPLPPDGVIYSCGGVGLRLKKRVKLPHPVLETTFLDGSSNPSEQRIRWPAPSLDWQP